MRGFFITGTDTEVGKSVVTASLAAAYRASGHQPRAVKPLASGSLPPGEDASLIAEHGGHNPINFACFPVPASPERAAKVAGITIDEDGLIQWCRAQTGHPTLMEGVGGWVAPLTPGMTVEDLAIAMGLPVIIVAANKLGMLNHTLLTVEAVRESGLPLAGVVINNGASAPSELQQWNTEDLRRWLGPSVRTTVLDAVDERAYAAAGARIIADLVLPSPRSDRP